MVEPVYTSLVQMFERSCERYGSRQHLGTKTQGRWVWTTYAETAKLVDQLRGGLASIGLKKGDCVCIVSNNRVEWAVLAYACFGLGAAVVPMYEAQLAKEWAFIANDCKAIAVVAATDEIYKKCIELKESVPSLEHVLGFSLPKDDASSYLGLIEAGKKAPIASIQPEEKDTACLIYTSGTTGNPKGVILSHGNIISNLNAVHEMLPLGEGDRSLSFLPWAHSFGFTCELQCMTARGAGIALNDSIPNLIPQLAEVEPTVLFSVPRIFNKIYDGVTKQMTEKPALVQNLFKAGIRAAQRRRKGESLGMIEKATIAIADKLVFSKIRAKFGGKLKYAFSGGSALSRDIAEFIDALGITVYEGYGLTETSPIATANNPHAHRIGSVGQPIPGVKIVIDKQASGDPKHGEIVVYGPNVMMGYWNRDEENAAVFTDDKGFRTGDLGFLDDDGYLYITGRIKEQYKLENGKYVAPAPLEEKLKLSPFIANVMIYGDNKLFNVALVVPEMGALKKWASENGVGESDDAKLVEHAKVKALLQEEVDKHSGEFKGFEKVKKVTLAPEDFTTENGMLTPSLKVKRRVVWQKYGSQIEALYAEGPGKSKSAAASA